MTSVQAHRKAIDHDDRPILNERQAAVMCRRFSLESAEDLPTSDPRICLMEGKARVVAAVVYGIIAEDDARQRYALSPMEFRVWRRLVEYSSYIPA